MGYAHPDGADAQLAFYRDHADRLIACSGEPTSYAEATTALGSGGNKIAEIAVGTGDFTIGAHPTNGRRLTVARQPSVALDAGVGSGVTHDAVALVDDANSRLLLATGLAAQVTTQSQPLDIRAWNYDLPVVA